MIHLPNLGPRLISKSKKHAPKMIMATLYKILNRSFRQPPNPVRAIRNRNMDSLSPRLCFRISKNSSERPAQHDCHQMSLGTVTTTLHSTAVTNYRAGPQASQEWERKAALSCWAERLGRRIYPVRAIRNRNRDSLSPCLCFRTQEQQ